MLLSLALRFTTAVATEDTNFIPSPEGYYEGSVLYSCNYLKGIGYASMILKDKADFWLTLTRGGHGTYIVNGQGTAIFDFSYAIDWTMGVKAGVSMMNVLGAKIDPKVTLSLDPKTSVQKFYLTGEVAAEDAKDGGVKLKDVTISWTPPNDEKAQKPKLKLQLIGSVSMDVSGSASMDKDFGKGPGGKPLGKANAEGAIGGGKFSPGTVAQTIDFDPPPPFGSEKFTVVLKKRSRSRRDFRNAEAGLLDPANSAQPNSCFEGKITSCARDLSAGTTDPGYPPSCEGLRRGRQMLELFVLEKRDQAR